MKINRKLNSLTYKEYLQLLENYKKFTDFNTLGLFRSILESAKLTLDQKIIVRNQAIAAFSKTFEFLQLKDPTTYFELTTLGQALTVADISKAWDDIRANQQRILESKRTGHRNFGTYSKHECGYDTCHLNGVMIRQGSGLSYPLPYCKSMPFHTDKKGMPEVKSTIRKQERKSRKQLITARQDSE